MTLNKTNSHRTFIETNSKEFSVFVLSLPTVSLLSLRPDHGLLVAGLGIGGSNRTLHALGIETKALRISLHSI